jgi:hypothetical protein
MTEFPPAAVSSPHIDSAWQRFKGFCCATWPRRALSLFVLASLCMAAGFGVGLLIFALFGPQQALQVLKTVTLVGVVVAVWHVLADNWSGIWKFLKLDDRSSLSKPLSQLAIAVTGAGLVAGADPPGPNPPIQESYATMLVASSVVAGPDEVVRTIDTARIMLPYFNTNITDPKPGELTPEKLKMVCEENLEKLASIDPAGIASVETLACGLRACSTPKHPVKLDVRGFASSRSFTCGGSPSPNENLELAERRRDKVMAILNGDLRDAKNCKSHAPWGSLIFEPSAAKRWGGNYEAMQQSRDLIDAREGSNQGPDRTREILTRRVDVVIADAGACAGPPQVVVAATTPQQ